MKGFACEKKEFVHNAEPDWEPVDLHESGGDVLSGFSVCQNPGSKVPSALQPLQGFAGHPKQDSITVVQSGHNERLNERPATE